ncbi:MAG TPA: TRAP transporter large permease subunit [Dehalococcoidia bacterium]|jgi:tripartite ATP-independent transporter DctM subunit|nr:TRAP transporter large permease subunit [Dehalococcoidia bacterium]
MIDLSPEMTAAVMLAVVFIGVMLGFPLAFVIGGIAVTMGILLFGPALATDIMYRRAYSLLSNYILLAVPGFIFMGVMLGYSGITEKMFSALYVWLGGFRGGLAVVTILVGTIMAATVGIIGASVTALAIIALPEMVKRGYSKSLASGAVCAGGTLGILIPPSIMLVVYGPMAALSVGKLFFAAFIPGFILSGLYITYITIYSFAKPQVAPVVAPEERAVPLLKKTADLFISLVPPAILIMAVLGSIFMGIATPTEAAGVGALAATLLAVAHRRFNLQVLKEAARETLVVSGMVMAIGAMAFAFVGVFMRAGGGDAVKEIILAAPGGKWGIFAIVMFVVFMLGYFIDWLGILFIVVPIITPVGDALGFDPLWFAMMICVNLQTSFMTPPFAYAIFYLKGAADPSLGITAGDIIRGVFPFVFLILIALGLLVAFPQLILWLPGQMIKAF